MANTVDVLKHIEKYEKKLKVNFFEEWDLEKYPFVLLLPDGSFATYGVDFNTIVVGPTSGKLKQLLDIFIKVAQVVGLKTIRTTTTRNPSAYAKLSGAHLVKTTRFYDKPTEYMFELEV